MSADQKDIWTLCEFLQAEKEGRPYDRAAAAALARQVGDRFPGIKDTLTLMYNRIAPDICAAA